MDEQSILKRELLKLNRPQKLKKPVKRLSDSSMSGRHTKHRRTDSDDSYEEEADDQ